MPTKVSFFPLDSSIGEIVTFNNLWRQQLVVLDRCCACVSGMGKLLIIYISIALLLESCGIWSFCCLGLTGLCWEVLWSFKLVGRASLAGAEMLWNGAWSLIFSCGVFGGRGTIGLLRDMKDQFMTWSFYFSRLCSSG